MMAHAVEIYGDRLAIIQSAIFPYLNVQQIKYKYKDVVKRLEPQTVPKKQVDEDDEI